MPLETPDTSEKEGSLGSASGVSGFLSGFAAVVSCQVVMEWALPRWCVFVCDVVYRGKAWSVEGWMHLRR